MSLFRDLHEVSLGGHDVKVRGKSGLVHARWELVIDGDVADTATAAGAFRLQARLPDGSSVEARVEQSLLGPTTVDVFHNHAKVAAFNGFVA